MEAEASTLNNEEVIKMNRHQMANREKSLLINELQGMSPLKINRRHYSRFTIEELRQELTRAKQASASGQEEHLLVH